MRTSYVTLKAACEIVAENGYKYIADHGAPHGQTLVKLRDKQFPGSMILDGFTANAVLTVYRSLGEENRKKFDQMPFTKAISIAWALVNRTKAN